MRSYFLAVIVGSTSFLAAAGANAQEANTDYSTRLGDTCSTIAQKAYGDRRAVELIRKANPQIGPAPHNFEPGTVLHCGGTRGRVSEVHVRDGLKSRRRSRDAARRTLRPRSPSRGRSGLVFPRGGGACGVVSRDGAAETLSGATFDVGYLFTR